MFSLGNYVYRGAERITSDQVYRFGNYVKSSQIEIVGPREYFNISLELLHLL